LEADLSGRAKGFDPLSNLFDAPNADRSLAEGQTPPAGDPVQNDDIDKVALARALAKAAATKAAAAAKPPPTAAVDKLALAKRLAAEAKARAAADQAVQPSPSAEPTPVDRAELAKALARAAKAKVAAQQAPAPAQKTSPVSERAPRTLADRATRRKPMSALEAARAAAAAEEQSRTQQVARPKPAAPSRASARPSTAAPHRRGQSSLLAQLGGGVAAESPRMASDRGLLTALWKAHALRHIEDGNWAVAGSCLAVVAALGRVPPGVLVAVPAMAGTQSLLAWVDVSKVSILAVIPNGRAYLAGLPGA
jgi:hypothetical protein